MNKVKPEKKDCSNPNYHPAQYVTKEMAIDAGDRSLEGSLYSGETCEQCGGCPECIYSQAIDAYEKYHNWRMSLLPDHEEILKIMLEAEGKHNRLVMICKLLPYLAKVISKRLGK